MFAKLIEKILYKKSDLLELIFENLAQEEVINPMTKDDVIRCSMLGKFCPREEALVIEGNIIRKNIITPKLRMTFQHGRLFENWFRDEILGNAKKVIGKWKCISCGDIQEEILGLPRYPKPSFCHKCKSVNFVYAEERKIDPTTNIGGSTDGFLYHDNDYYILEMKTCNSNSFRTYKSIPNQDHVVQANAYMWLHGYKKAKIFYFNKDTSEIVEHNINIDWKIVEDSRSKALELKEYFNTGKLPRRTCPFNDCKRALSCSVVDKCFSLEN